MPPLRRDDPVTTPNPCRRSLVTLLASLAWIPVCPAQLSDAEVPYVQTPQNVVDAMLEIAGVGASDILIDLGSGDGRIVTTAAKRLGARGLGVEIDPRLVELSRRLAAEDGVSERAVFRVQDLFETDLGPATVITMYLLPEVNLQLRPRLLGLRPGTRVVSHDWDMGDWIPDRTVLVEAPEKKIGRDKVSRLHLWVIPASVGGRWSWRQPAEGPGGAAMEVALAITQRYQQLSGELTAGTVRAPLEARLSGDRIEFAIDLAGGGLSGRWKYTGRVDGVRILGEAAGPDGKVRPWHASRG